MISSSTVREEVVRLNAELVSLKAETSLVARDFVLQKERSITNVSAQNRQISSFLNTRLRQRYNEIPLDCVGQTSFEDANLITNIAIVNTIDNLFRIIRYKEDGDEVYKTVGRVMKVAEEKINTINTSPNPTDSLQVIFSKLDSAKGAIEVADSIIRLYKDMVKEDIPNV